MQPINLYICVTSVYSLHPAGKRALPRIRQSIELNKSLYSDFLYRFCHQSSIILIAFSCQGLGSSSFLPGMQFSSMRLLRGLTHCLQYGRPLIRPDTIGSGPCRSGVMSSPQSAQLQTRRFGCVSARSSMA